MLLKLKALVNRRNARQTHVMQTLQFAGFGKPRKVERTPVVRSARNSWIDLFDLVR